MSINTSTVDAYIAKRGFQCRIGDADWPTILKKIQAVFGRRLRHRCRLVTQPENPLARYCTVIPDGVPQPYRHIFYLEIYGGDSPKMRGLERWLSARAVLWNELWQLDPESKEHFFAGLRIYGFEPQNLIKPVPKAIPGRLDNAATNSRI